MGADLIGYFVKGPHKFTAKARRAAVKAAQAQIDLCKEVTAWVDKHDGSPSCNEIAGLLALGAAPSGAIRELLQDGNLDEIEDYAALDAAKEVEKFLLFWRDPGCRDVAWRVDPDNPKDRLLFAGDMSWGDEPEGGGYTAIKEAYALCIPDALGIR